MRLRTRIPDWSLRALTERLEVLFARAPELRPQPELYDYPLTYPPAVQIQQDVHARPPTDAEFVRDAVGSLPAAGYYFHFGFCQYRCRYCFHYELTTRRDAARRDAYVDAMSTQMRRFGRRHPELRTGLYFLGGGTPTVLDVGQLDRFLTVLTSTFGPPPTSMSTVEAKPATASWEKLRLLRDAGLRRVNLGVQTLDPEVYAHHHQKEPVQVALDAIARARSVGFDWINIDLMVGLERQTAATWGRTLAQVDALISQGAIDSLFIYPYHDDPRSQTYGRPERLPSFVETAHAEHRARQLLHGHGWRELGARFFRSGRHIRRELGEVVQTRINPAYGEVLYHGFGNSSFSLGDRAVYLNHRSVDTYIESVNSGGGSIAHWYTMSDAQRATRDVTFDLLYSPVTRLRSRTRKYGAASMEHHERLIDRWVELGLGQRRPLLGGFSLTPLGKLVHRQMIPVHYLVEDRQAFNAVMTRRQEAGRRYRGY